MLDRAGFADVTGTTIVAEAGLVTGRRPVGEKDQQAGPASPPGGEQLT